MACRHWYARGLRNLFTPWPTGNAVAFMPVPGRPRVDHGEIAQWLETDAAKGVYVCDTTWPEGRTFCKFDEIGHTYRFSDPRTAMHVKMRWG